VKTPCDTVANEPANVDLDRKALDEIRAFGGEEVLRKVIGIFLQSSPALLESLRAGARQGDPAVLAKAAHALKSACGYLGARRLMLSCERVEREARGARICEASVQVAAIEQEYIAAVRALECEVEGQAP